MSKIKNIVLIHGWGASTKKLLPLADELRKLGWKVFLPELPGFDAGVPKDAWGISDYADLVYKEAKKKFAAPFYVFGHSFGGGIAIVIASEKSHDVKGVFLCATRGISRGNTIKRGVFWFLAKAGKILLFVPVLNIAYYFKKILYKAAREHDYEKTEGIMKEVFKKIISEDLKPYLSKLKLPVFILWGERDRMTPPSDAYFIKKRVINSRLKMFRDQGHKLPYEKPRVIAQTIDGYLS